MSEAGEIAGKGVQTSRTLVPSRSKDVPLRMTNLRDVAVRLHKGATVAELQHVDVVETVTPPTKEERQQEYISELIRGTDYRLSAAHKKKSSGLLKEFSDTLSVDEYDMGRTGVIEHHIDTGQHPPIRQALRRHPPQKELMVKQKIIELSVGGWTSNVVLVRKKDDTLRFCVDYRRLNEVSQKDAYPLPRIDACLDTMNGIRWFSTFDIRSGYHQVLMDEESRDKTTFVTRERTFRFLVMPFGLTGVPATFQRLMDVVISGLNLEVCLVYIWTISLSTQQM